MQQFRIHNQPKDEQLIKERNYYHELGKIYYKLIGNKKYPHAATMRLACLRAASQLDDANAQYELAEILLNEAKFCNQLQLDGLFASTTNERYMRQLYEEAFIYLELAEKLGHSLAKRLHGLCLINGWGIASDKEKGFSLIVASIEQENSWDKVPQIFAEIGLNKPEFFAAIMKHSKAHTEIGSKPYVGQEKNK